MRTNKTKKKLQAAQPVLGAMMNIPAPALVELCGYAGFDFVFIDCEHGAIGIESLVEMVRAADNHDVTAIVRVPRNAPDAICKVLDTGASGIIVPGVTTGEDAERAVRSAKYSPLGVRGVGNGRARGYGHLMPVKEYAPRANAETMVVALLEDIEVIDNLDAILEVQGIDVFIVGPNDLSQSMDLVEQTVSSRRYSFRWPPPAYKSVSLVGYTDHPRFQEAKNIIIDHVLGAGKIMGTRIRDVDEAKRSLDRGFLWLHVALQDILVRTARQLIQDIGSLV